MSLLQICNWTGQKWYLLIFIYFNLLKHDAHSFTIPSHLPGWAKCIDLWPWWRLPHECSQVTTGWQPPVSWSLWRCAHTPPGRWTEWRKTVRAISQQWMLCVLWFLCTMKSPRSRSVIKERLSQLFTPHHCAETWSLHKHFIYLSFKCAVSFLMFLVLQYIV